MQLHNSRGCCSQHSQIYEWCLRVVACIAVWLFPLAQLMIVEWQLLESIMRALCVLSFPILDIGPHSVIQAKVQWCDHCSLELLGSNDPPTSLLSDYRFMPLCMGNFKAQWHLLNLKITFFFGERVSLCHPGSSAVAQSWLTATSASQVQVILLTQPPK